MHGSGTSMFAAAEVTWGHEPTEPPPPTKRPSHFSGGPLPGSSCRHQDRWFGAHLVQGCRRLTSGFSFWRPSDSRVARGSFSGLARLALCTRTQGARGAMRPVSCGFVPKDAWAALTEVRLRVHAQGMRMHCTGQRDIPRSPANVVGSEC